MKDYIIMFMCRSDQQMNRNRPMDLIIAPIVELLELRCNVFDSPADVEGKVCYTFIPYCI